MLRIAFALALLAGCTEKREPSAPPPSPTEEAPRKNAKTPHKSPIPWIHDDADAAFAQAVQRKLPLVVDFWAPWCHTCLSMKHTVLLDPGLAPLADRFVWLMVNTDLDRNQPLTAKYPVRSWPTYIVVSPADESVVARQIGAAAVGEFREFLLTGERAALASLGTGTLEPADEYALAGAQAMTAGSYPAATAHYQKALEVAPKDWPRRIDTLVAIQRVHYLAEQWPACVEHGQTHEAEVTAAGNVLSSDVLTYTAMCADKLPPEPRMAVYRAMAKPDGALRRLADDADANLSIDDRSEVLGLLFEVYKTTGAAEAAASTAVRRTTLLDTAARSAETAYERMTYSWPRIAAHMQRGTLSTLVPDLEQLAVDLPTEYDPPYRLAYTLLKLDQPANALPYAQKAAELVTGRRAARVHGLLADIYKSTGDRDGELRERKKVVDIFAAEPASPRTAKSLAKARAALEALEGQAPAAK